MAAEELDLGQHATAPERGEKVLGRPRQHLGRSTASPREAGAIGQRVMVVALRMP